MKLITLTDEHGRLMGVNADEIAFFRETPDGRLSHVSTTSGRDFLSCRLRGKSQSLSKKPTKVPRTRIMLPQLDKGATKETGWPAVSADGRYLQLC